MFGASGPGASFSFFGPSGSNSGSNDAGSEKHDTGDGEIRPMEMLAVPYAVIDGREFTPQVIAPTLSLDRVVVRDGQLAKSRPHLSDLGISDLVPTVYEGGYKVWECSIDLCQVLLDALFQQQQCLSSSNLIVNRMLEFSKRVRASVVNGSVLEAGCGHGLPTLVAILGGCRTAVLHDYNREVLEDVTIPNVLKFLSTHPDAAKCTLEFVSGDWSAYETARTFDCILTSETIYSTNAIQRLHKLLVRYLSPNGIALVAAKRLYFGLDGGILEFQQLVSAEGSLDSQMLVTMGSGTVLRDILLVQRRR
eukprot:ANDGO_00251.mRNA.1 Histidine protein methyltransferase 1 homolog